MEMKIGWGYGIGTATCMLLTIVMALFGQLAIAGIFLGGFLTSLVSVTVFGSAIEKIKNNAKWDERTKCQPYIDIYKHYCAKEICKYNVTYKIGAIPYPNSFLLEQPFLRRNQFPIYAKNEEDARLFFLESVNRIYFDFKISIVSIGCEGLLSKLPEYQSL